MIEIIDRIHRISNTTVLLFSTRGWRDDSVTFTCVIKRSADNDKIEISREATTADEALNLAWNAFRKLVTEGYDPQDLAPLVITVQKPIDDEIPY